MKSLTLVGLLVTALCLSLPPVSAHAQEAVPAQPAVEAQTPPTPAVQPLVRLVEAPNDGAEALVSMSFDETPLTDVIKAFRDVTGANIISGGTNLQGTVSVRLDNVPWKKGLTSILDQQNLRMTEQPPNSGIYVVSAKTVAEIPKITQTFSLAHARADDVATLFKSFLGTSGMVTPFPSANVVIVTATEQQIGECEKIITAIDKPRAQVYIEARFVELSASASKKLGLNWQSLGGDGWGVSFDGATLGYTDDRSTVTTKGHGSSGSSSSSDSSTLSDTFLDDERSIANEIVSENLLNSGTTRSYNETKTRNKSQIFTGSLSAQAFELAINAFEQMDGVSVFSNPKVIVANEESARVDMTTKEPNVEVSFQAATSDNGSDSITTKLALIPGKEEPFVGEAFFSYGISLKVKPRVSASGLITVDIEPSISELIKYFELQGINQETPSAKFPVIEIRRIKTIFTMNDGKTAVIGGLTKTTEESIDSGIPFLRELPWIGPRVFGWKSREKDQKEIIIFVTVGIADPVEMLEDVGMPKNAVLGRDLMAGKTTEPGDKTREELLSLDEEIRPPRLNRSEKPAAPAAEAAPEAAEAPATTGTEAEAAQPAQ